MLDSADFSEWSNEFRRLQEELSPFQRKLSAKVGPLGAEEEIFDQAYYFYQAALINNADIFSYLPFTPEMSNALKAIGAKGCLAVADKLLTLRERVNSLPSEEGQKLWKASEAEIEKETLLAEHEFAFARLLVDYAQRNSSRIGQ